MAKQKRDKKLALMAAIGIGIVIALVLASLAQGIYYLNHKDTYEEEDKQRVLEIEQNLKNEEEQKKQEDTIYVPETVEEPIYVPKELYAEEMYNEQYTKREYWLLCAAVYAETGSQSNKAQRLTLSVLLNRVKAAEFPNTIEGVIYQVKPCLQYECTINGALEKYRAAYTGERDLTEEEIESLERCAENVNYIIAEGPIAPPDVLYQSREPLGSSVYYSEDGEFWCRR